MPRYGKGVSRGRTAKSIATYPQRLEANARLEIARAMYEHDFFEGMEMDYRTVCFGNDYFHELIKKSVLDAEMAKGNIEYRDGKYYRIKW